MIKPGQLWIDKYAPHHGLVVIDKSQLYNTFNVLEWSSRNGGRIHSWHTHLCRETIEVFFKLACDVDG